MLHLLATAFFMAVLAMVAAVIVASIAATGDRIIALLERGMGVGKENSSLTCRQLCQLPRASRTIRPRVIRPVEALRAAA